jgi:hypothetical protein
MGKSLIIKGADFSNSAIPTFFPATYGIRTAGFYESGSGYYFQNNSKYLTIKFAVKAGVTYILRSFVDNLTSENLNHQWLISSSDVDLNDNTTYDGSVWYSISSEGGNIVQEDSLESTYSSYIETEVTPQSDGYLLAFILASDVDSGGEGGKWYLTI